MIRNVVRLAPLAAAGAVVALGAGTAVAGPLAHGPVAPRATAPAHSAKAAGISPHVALTGYQQVSATFTDPAQSQVRGEVACPTGTVVVGGGAVISSSSLSENLNSSYPLGNSWVVYVDNASTTSGTFTVRAVCVTKVAKHAIVVGTGVSNPAGTQTQATVTCPTGTVALGGGGVASSGSIAVNLNSSLPLSGGAGWRVDMNNNGGGTDTVTGYAVCGRKPSAYSVVSGPGTALAASTQGHDQATCPTGTLVLGGGGYSTSSSPSVDLNSTIPSGSTGWFAYENDTAITTSTITAYAVCAGA